MKSRHLQLVLNHSLATLCPYEFAQDDSDKILSKLRSDPQQWSFIQWKSLLALHYFYVHFPDQYSITTDSPTSYTLHLRRTLQNTVPGLPYCLDFVNVMHQLVCLRKKNRPITIREDISRGRLMRSYMKELAILGLHVLRGGLSFSFQHESLSSVSHIENIPGFMEFKDFFDQHSKLYEYAISQSFKCFALTINFSTSISSSPVSSSLPLSPSSSITSDRISSPVPVALTCTSPLSTKDDYQYIYEAMIASHHPVASVLSPQAAQDFIVAVLHHHNQYIFDQLSSTDFFSLLGDHVPTETRQS